MNQNISLDIAKRLKAARKVEGYNSARQFANKNNIPESTYNQYETGKRQFNAESIIEFTQLLGVNPNWLLTGQLPPYINSDYHKEKLLYQELENNFGQETESLFEDISIDQKAHYVIINLPLLKTVLSEIFAFIRYAPNLSYILSIEELINYIFDIYNNVISTFADEKTQYKMIQLAISSLNRSLGSSMVHQDNDVAKDK
jgi:transcriptional regulator with XRE-family HTH domain